jgi:hypothetical protein
VKPMSDSKERDWPPEDPVADLVEGFRLIDEWTKTHPKCQFEVSRGLIRTVDRETGADLTATHGVLYWSIVVHDFGPEETWSSSPADAGSERLVNAVNLALNLHAKAFGS